MKNQHYNSNHKIKDIDAPNKLEAYHVKRHQDSRKRKDQLAIAEKRNIKADRVI